ncbi:MAG: putative rane protein, partial [Spirosoma sp.]|nr:putative rane protein [Spirosoma sp.]
SWSPALLPLPAALVGLGTLAMAIFFLLTLGSWLGTLAIWLVLAGAVSWIVNVAITRRAKLQADWRAARRPLVTWLGVSLIGTALVVSADSGGGSWAINGLFTPLRWSSDNQLSMLFTETLLSTQPRDQMLFAVPWLVTDRGPLLAALLAFPRVIMGQLGRHWGSSFNAHIYLSAAIVVQSSWILLVHFLASYINIRRENYLTLSLMGSPFLIFNTLYAWPKLLGGIYAVICAALLFAPGARSVVRCRGVVPAIAASAAFAYLSHASNVFALVPIAIFAIPTIWLAGLSSILAGTGVAVLVVAPWLWWLVSIQPGATALMRYALANDFGMNRRNSPIWPDILAYYRSLGWAGWITSKIEALKIVGGFPRAWMAMPETAAQAPRRPPFGDWRLADFFSLTRALNAGMLVIPLMLLARFRRVQLAPSGLSKVFILLGATSILFTLLITVPPAILHVLPYGGVLLLLLGLLLFADSLPVDLARLVPMFSIIYAIVVWLGPALIWADRVVWSGVVGIIVGVAITAGAMYDDGAATALDGQ